MSASAEQRVLEAIDRLAPEYEQLLQALVRIPSPIGEEGDAQAFVGRHMRDIGLSVDSFDVDVETLRTHPAFNPSPRAYSGRPCVVGRAAGSGGGRSLMLNAHIDTVPVEAAEAWTHPPYGGAIENGRLFGRGACDDKAGVVESLLVARAIKTAGIALAGDLILASVIEDESTGNGSLACVERGHAADGVIIVDGTWPERFIVSHMGHVTFRIRLTGRAGHATSKGPNPIAAIGLVAGGLRALVERRNAAQTRSWGTSERSHFLNLGTIHGGVWPGSVPAAVSIEGQFGFPPPGTCEQAKDDLRDALQHIAGRSDWPLEDAPSIEFAGLETPPQLGDAANPIARLVSDTVARLRNGRMAESIIAGHCDLRHFTRARRHPTSAACLYGPGGGQNVHGADESFDLSHLPLVAGNLASVALSWCGVAGDGA